MSVTKDREETGVEEAAEEEEHSHWVQRLFPPANAFTLEQLLADIGKEKGLKEPSAFEAFAHGTLSTLDAGSVKNVYERVWLLHTLQQQMQAGLTQGGADLRGTLTFSRGADGGLVEMRHVGTDTNDFFDLQGEGEEGLWDTDEISMLREVFRATREKNSQLRASIQEVAERYEALRVKFKSQRETLESRTRKLTEAVKANERLHILSNNLSTELKTALHKIDTQRTMIGALEKAREKQADDASEARKAADAERLRREGVEAEVARLGSQQASQRIVFEEQVKAQYERQLNELKRCLVEKEAELEEVRSAHARDKRGLEHLRTHFASLPYAEVPGQGNNMVYEDQLKKFSL